MFGELAENRSKVIRVRFFIFISSIPMMGLVFPPEIMKAIIENKKERHLVREYANQSIGNIGFLKAYQENNSLYVIVRKEWTIASSVSCSDREIAEIEEGNQDLLF